MGPLEDTLTSTGSFVKLALQPADLSSARAALRAACTHALLVHDSEWAVCATGHSADNIRCALGSAGSFVQLPQQPRDLRLGKAQVGLELPCALRLGLQMELRAHEGTAG